MSKRSLKFLPSKQSHQMTQLAERARLSLSRYAGIDVEYNAIGLQTLDEWIDRHLNQFPKPSYEIKSVWAAFLGETFRRRFEGQWGIAASTQRPRLGIICSKDNGGLVFVDIMNQINRRIRSGMNESLAFYYTIKGVEIKA